MDSTPIVAEQTYNVPVNVVWRAITDPVEMRKWFFDSIIDFDAVPGFETQFDVDVEGVVYPHIWKVTEVDPERSICYDWRYGGFAGESVVTWELSETPAGTHLKLSHLGGESFSQDIPLFSRESGQAGWNYFVQDSLKAFLEQN